MRGPEGESCAAIDRAGDRGEEMRDPERARAVAIGRGGLGLVRDSGEVYCHTHIPRS